MDRSAWSGQIIPTLRGSMPVRTVPVRRVLKIARMPRIRGLRQSTPPATCRQVHQEADTEQHGDDNQHQHPWSHQTIPQELLPTPTVSTPTLTPSAQGVVDSFWTPEPNISRHHPEGPAARRGRRAATGRRGTDPRARCPRPGAGITCVPPGSRGDRPPPDLNALAEAAINQARTDRGAARQLLQQRTFACRSLARFEEQRAYLSGVSIPAEFLPAAGELGRTDLV
jgi:hypothetical protein